ncbi:CBS domain-containing protein [Stigmatella erecta]|uniref:CBS domain-containing protein n=1 Tax=Stigmatella erecta TaxID=83460 RepID=A0A1I0F3U3_9BACT|nr:CBS domain-containing protein [Stigmatella erecta]SET52499.1 CBS domain-containing protein [Stigmatella erecta]
MKLSAVMNPDVRPISPEQTLTEAALRMRQQGSGLLPVCSSRKMVGLLTDRDIVFQAIAERLDPQQTRVSEILPDSAPCHAFEDDELATAAQLMAEHHLNHLPVLDRDRNLVGMVSLDDIAREALDAPTDPQDLPLSGLTVNHH